MTHDRYRVRQGVSQISEAIWIVAEEYGIHRLIATDEQVAISRTLREVLASRSGPLKRSDIDGAFRKYDMRVPPRGFARDVIARLERLDR
jgi:hypothetical protein